MLLLALVGLFISPLRAARPDGDTQRIIERILSARVAHERTRPKGERVAYAAFLDFDGTIIDGDITEGMAGRKGRPGYTGLAERAILAGLSRDYAGRTGFEAYMAEYERRLARDHGEAYAWGAEQFADLGPEREGRLRALVDEHFAKVLEGKLFSSSVAVIRALQSAGVRCYVISASPTPFVHGARVFFRNIPLQDLSGIDRRRDSSGHLLDPIVNFGPGKILRLRQLLRRAGGKTVVLAAFGNSWSTDGPFLRYVSRIEKGVAVMINGGKPPLKRHGLTLVSQRRTLEMGATPLR